MNAYPRLSQKAYDDPTKKLFHQEVMDVMTDAAAAVWRYYEGQSLTDSQNDVLHNAIVEAMVKNNCKNQSWFPLRIKETKTGSEYIVKTPADIPNGVEFTVEECNARI